MQKPHIYGFWHSKLFITPIFFKDVEKKLAMSSPTKDGELISVPLEKMGYVLVRGSSDKKSISSTISLLKYLKTKKKFEILDDKNLSQAEYMVVIGGDGTLLRSFKNIFRDCKEYNKILFF